MISPIRIGILLVTLSASPLIGQDGGKKDTQSSPCLKLVKWPGIAQETPAICVVRNGWYFCMLPEKINATKAAAPKLKSGELIFETKILQIDPVHRVCLIEQIGGETDQDAPVAISSAKESKPGTTLTSMCPGNSCRTLVAGKDQHYLGEALPGPLLRVRVEDDSVCQPGTPLINDKGELEALLTEREMAGEKEAHAIPAAALQKMITDYQAHKRTGAVWIGAVFQSGATTLEVLEIRENSPASKGGIKVGDVILRVEDADVNDFPSLVEVFQSLPAGKETTFKVLRGLDEKELIVVPEFIKNTE